MSSGSPKAVCPRLHLEPEPQCKAPTHDLGQPLKRPSPLPRLQPRLKKPHQPQHLLRRSRLRRSQAWVLFVVSKQPLRRLSQRQNPWQKLPNRPLLHLNQPLLRRCIQQVKQLDHLMSSS